MHRGRYKKENEKGKKKKREIEADVKRMML